MSDLPKVLYLRDDGDGFLEFTCENDLDVCAYVPRGEFIKLEQENQRLREALLRAKKLLEDSAQPFDAACMIIRELLAQNKE